MIAPAILREITASADRELGAAIALEARRYYRVRRAVLAFTDAFPDDVPSSLMYVALAARLKAAQGRLLDAVDKFFAEGRR